MSRSPVDDSNSLCLKCEKDFKDGEVTVAVLWWVGYEQDGTRKVLTEQIVYRYCYPCARGLDLENMRVFQLEKGRFRLEGALDVPDAEALATCNSCGNDIFTGKPFAIIRVVLEFQSDSIAEELCELFSWTYCSDCAPKVDLDNIFVLEAEQPVHLLELAQKFERERTK